MEIYNSKNEKWEPDGLLKLEKDPICLEEYRLYYFLQENTNSEAKHAIIYNKFSFNERKTHCFLQDGSIK
jgi:hypothetical protein